MNYEYKVIHPNIGNVTTKNVKDKEHGKILTAQIELLLYDLANQGWELVGMYDFYYQVVNEGIFSNAVEKEAETARRLVFKRPK